MSTEIQIRRGTLAALAGITPDSGELCWTTDTNELFVGDGVTAGAQLVAGRAYEALTPSAAATPSFTMAANRRAYEGKIVPGAGSGSYTWSLVLLTANRRAGDTAEISIRMPASANPTVQLLNASNVGTVLYTASPDAGKARNYFVKLTFTGTAWELQFAAEVV